MSLHTLGWGLLFATSGMALIYVLLSLMTRNPTPPMSVKQVSKVAKTRLRTQIDTATLETRPLPHTAYLPAEESDAKAMLTRPAARSLGSIRILPPHRLRWRIAAAAGITIILLFAVYKLVGPGTPTNAASLAETPLVQQPSGFLYVEPEKRVIFLDVQGSAQTTTGNWDEADVVSSKFVSHFWSFSYYFNQPNVRLVLTTDKGNITIYGTVNDTATQITLRLPPDQLTGLFPQPAIFNQASEADYNSAVTTLASTVPYSTAIPGTSHDRR